MLIIKINSSADNHYYVTNNNNDTNPNNVLMTIIMITIIIMVMIIMILIMIITTILMIILTIWKIIIILIIIIIIIIIGPVCMCFSHYGLLGLAFFYLFYIELYFDWMHFCCYQRYIVASPLQIHCSTVLCGCFIGMQTLAQFSCCGCMIWGRCTSSGFYVATLS